MRALRIALIASSRYPVKQPFAGGLEAHVWHLADVLRKAGHRVTLFAGPGSDPELDCELIDVRPAPLSTAARTDISMPPEHFMQEHHAYLDLMLRLSRRYGDSFDVIHNHSLHYLPVAMTSTLNTPVLTTLHTPRRRGSSRRSQQAVHQGGLLRSVTTPRRPGGTLRVTSLSCTTVSIRISGGKALVGNN